MNFASLTEYFVLVVVVACLAVGYIIKHATFLKWIPNDDIPVILAVVGLAMNMFVSKPSVESAVYGAVMGLASTGLHQQFTRWIENKNEGKNEDDNVEGEA